MDGRFCSPFRVICNLIAFISTPETRKTIDDENKAIDKFDRDLVLVLTLYVAVAHSRLMVVRSRLGC
jgi:hypothetical protein